MKNVNMQRKGIVALRDKTSWLLNRCARTILKNTHTRRHTLIIW